MNNLLVLLLGGETSVELHDCLVEDIKTEEAVLVEELAAGGREGGVAGLLLAVSVHQGQLVHVVKPGKNI